MRRCWWAKRAGNSEAFAALVNHYDQSVYRLAVNITRNQEDAEDVQQETLFKAYANLGRFQGGSRFYTWLVRTAMNEALMKLRKRRSHKQESLDELMETDDNSLIRWETEHWRDNPERRYARRELQQVLAEAMEGLEPRSRDVFLLRDVEDFSTRETAEHAWPFGDGREDAFATGATGAPAAAEQVPEGHAGVWRLNKECRSCPSVDKD